MAKAYTDAQIDDRCKRIWLRVEPRINMRDISLVRVDCLFLLARLADARKEIAQLRSTRQSLPVALRGEPSYP